MPQTGKKEHRVGPWDPGPAERSKIHRYGKNFVADCYTFWNDPKLNDKGEQEKDVDGKWQTNGKFALRKIMETSPTAFVKLMVDLQPKTVTHEAGETLAELLTKVEEEDREIINVTPDAEQDTNVALLPRSIRN